MKTSYTHLPILTKLGLFCLFMLLAPIHSYARNVTFTWTANKEPSVIGYKLYYKTGTETTTYEGTDLNIEGSPIIIKNIGTTTTTVIELSPNKTYQFVITAFSETDESGYSTVKTFPPLSFLSPTINTMSQK